MKTKINKRIAIILIWCLLFQIIAPIQAVALTSGPSKPEVQSFEPISTSEMVNTFTGDFNYNIPLFEIGGYPMNLIYHAGQGVEDEASWVGLGWNLNPGAINRGMRGIPDDFAGEVIKRETKTLDNLSVSLMSKPEIEVFGFQLKNAVKFKSNLGIRYNNYKGLSLFSKFDFGIDLIKTNAFKLDAGLSVGFDEGVNFTPNLSTNLAIGSFKNGGLTGVSLGIAIGAPYSSREGLKELTFNRSFNLSSAFTATYENDDLQQGFIFDGRTSAQNSVGGALITYNTPSYTPEITNNSTSHSYEINVAPGIEFTGFNVEPEFTGTANTHSIIPLRRVRSYGYAYHHLARVGFDLMDFNREKDGTYFKSTNFLAPTILTNDTYMVSGQGVGGAFRAFRNQVGLVSDPIAINININGSAGFDLGFPSGGTKIGINGSNVKAFGYSGLWGVDNLAARKYKYKANNLTANELINYEPYYFKMIGEFTPDLFKNETSKYDYLLKDKPVRLNLANHTLSDEFIEKNGTKTYLDHINKAKVTRSQAMTYLDIQDADYAALNTTTSSYVPNEVGDQFQNFDNKNKVFFKEFDITPTERISQLNAGIKNKQFYEIIQHRKDGMKYVYGLPIYNLQQKEATFNVAGNSISSDKYTVNYTTNDVTNNSKGIDHFSYQETLPGYAYSHLLTAVLSSDYVDYDQNGPSDSDLGNWVKFNYSCTATKYNDAYSGITKTPYQWRFPFVRNDLPSGTAQYNSHFKTTIKDDKANYVYGQKELWNVHSIESRDQIALFYVSERKDNFGAIDELGHISTTGNKQVKLDSIRIYNKSDFFQNAGTQNAPVALKTVHFTYDYSLCRGIPNSSQYGSNMMDEGGKLTLKEVFFTYGNSIKGQFSKYKFNYYDQTFAIHFIYDPKSIDRWGLFKPNDPLKPNNNFPYAEQNKAVADINSKFCNLRSIELPSGGKMNIEYESDDYAYVQNKRATSMHYLTGTSHLEPKKLSDVSGVGNNISNLYDGKKHFNYLVFKIDPLTNESNESLMKTEFNEKYIDGLTKRLLYFKAAVNIKKNANGGENDYEFVPGYIDIEDSGAFVEKTNSGQNEFYGWIKIRPVGYGDSETRGSELNPITKTAWQFARLNLPHIIYPDQSNDVSNLTQLIKSLTNAFTKEIPRMVDFNKSLKWEGICRTIIPSKTVIRLTNADYNKIGGGHRVKAITINDNWKEISNNPSNNNAIYGQQYFYKTLLSGNNGEQKMISSGVASYEPALGNEENPLKLPITTIEKFRYAPDNNYYTEEPIGESYYPSAIVGYSKVLTANIRSAQVSATATGYSISEFYTAQDFPYEVNVDKTNFEPEKSGFLQNYIKGKRTNYMSASQGYSIILNDMHGQPKSISKFAGKIEVNPNGELGDNLILKMEDLSSKEKLINSTSFYYKVNNKNQLENKVNVINGMKVSELEIGVESEMVIDAREHKNFMVNKRLNVNFDFISGVPFPIPSAGVSRTTDENRFRASVVTKVVNKHGILDRTVVYDNGSYAETRNVIYDQNTGDVMVTSVNNEFINSEGIQNTATNNLIYSLKMPAHWAYREMGSVVKNMGNQIYLVKKLEQNTTKYFLTDENGQLLPLPDNKISNYFSEGDVLLDLSTHKKYWVELSLIDNYITLYDENNSSSEIQYNAAKKYKVVESGNKNLLTQSICSILSKSSPKKYIGRELDFDFYNSILSIVPMTYSKFNTTECNSNGPDCESIHKNKYLAYSLIYRPYQNYAQINGVRTSNQVNNSGLLLNNPNFWVPSSIFWGKNVSGFSLVNQNNKYNRYGSVLETETSIGKDLKIYSSQIMGYDHRRIIATASNAQFEKYAYTGFEEYEYNNSIPGCRPNLYFNIENVEQHLAFRTAHTGNFSLDASVNNVVGSSELINYPRFDCYQFPKNLKGKYIIDCWARGVDERRLAITIREFGRNGNNQIEIGNTFDFSPIGPEINGWRRIYKEIDLGVGFSNGIDRLDFEFQGGFFDDLRIHPKEALMTSYVYDPRTFKLTAELDENNHASFYEYDAELSLIRIKKETERGIVTIQENRQNIKRQ